MTSSRRRPDLASLLPTGLTILYPILVVVSVHLLGSLPALALLCTLLLLNVITPTTRSVPKDLLWLTVMVVAAVVALGSFSAELGVRIYPVAMNAAMLYAFARTLWHPPSMIERFARLVEPDLDADGVRYTRRVTMVWVGFFVVNGSMALWSVIAGSWLAWTVYNGAISYMLAGLLFPLEYLIRQRVRQSRSLS
jgi:uncharacterized membrane protein